MSDYRPATLSPLIEQMFVVAFSPSSADNERAKTLRMIDPYLKSVGIDGYKLLELLKTPPVSDEDMQKVFDAGRELGRTENAVTVTAAPKQPFNSPPSAVRSRIYNFEDSDRISGSDIHGGYTWSVIAEWCYANLNRIPDQHHGFLEGMADQLGSWGDTVSGKQAKYLANLFNRYLGGKI